MNLAPRSFSSFAQGGILSARISVDRRGEPTVPVSPHALARLLRTVTWLPSTVAVVTDPDKPRLWAVRFQLQQQDGRIGLFGGLVGVNTAEALRDCLDGQQRLSAPLIDEVLPALLDVKALLDAANRAMPRIKANPDPATEAAIALIRGIQDLGFQANQVKINIEAFVQNGD